MRVSEGAIVSDFWIGGISRSVGVHDPATIDRTLLPALRLDCGLEDGLLEENRAFHRHLEQLGIPHEYAECPGAHTWEYWDCHIQEALAFHQRVLGLGD
jgi:putative tributyrin esterase